MLASIPSKLLSEWMAFASLEPFGPLREDLRAGQIAALLGNAHFKRAQPATPADYFATLAPEPEESEVEPMTHSDMLLAKMKAIGFAVAGRFPETA